MLMRLFDSPSCMSNNFLLMQINYYVGVINAFFDNE